MEKVNLHPKARSDLEDIWLYGLNEWGVNQADSYLHDLNKTFLLIAGNPFIARENTEFNPPIRIHPHRSHKIVYRIEGEHVSVVRILHKSMFTELHL